MLFNGDDDGDGSRTNGVCSTATPPISRKVSEDSAPAAPAPITSEFSNHTLSIHPPLGLSQRPHLLPLSLFSDKGVPGGERDLWREQNVWLYSEVAISPRQPRHPAVPPVGNGSCTVILFEELMGKACPSTGIFIGLITVKPTTAGL